VAVLKLSQIAPFGGASPASSDQIVSVVTGTTDNLVTYAKATGALSQFTTSAQGVVAGSGGGTTNFLRADGTWAVPPGSGSSPGGANTDVQYNNSGSFGGNAGFTYDGSGVISLGTSSATTGLIDFVGKTSGTVALSVQDAAGTWTMKLPTTGGTNGYVLQTDGSGNTSWVIQSGSAGTITIGSTTVSGGAGTGQVLYENGLVQEAADFTIISGQPNVIAGSAYLYDSSQVIIAQIGNSNFYEGGAGNLSGTGFNNLGTGSNALVNIGTGNSNLMVGTGAGAAISSGGSNSGVGTNAVHSCTSGNGNIGIGSSAMQGSALYTGNNNIALGASALFNYAGASGPDDSNVAIGHGVMQNLQTGGTNVGIGDNALGNTASTGLSNIGVGQVSLYNVTGDNNIGIGGNTGQDVTSGRYNTLIGGNTGRGITTGGFNTVIGANVTGLSSSLTNAIIISDSQGNIGLDYNVTNAFGWTTWGTQVFAQFNRNLNNGAGSSTGTLLNAPAVGNPTKWLQVNDNGTTRYIPAW
jgi:hypothetical protein